MNSQAGRRRIAALWGNIQWHHIFGSVDRQIFDSSILLQLTWLHLFVTAANQTTKLALKVRWYYKHYLACGSLSLIVLLPWYLIRPISIYWNSYFAWGSKTNEMHQFFFSWTFRWCFLLYFPKSRWTGWILMLWNWYKLIKMFLLTGTLISHNVTVVMHTGDVKLQGNGVILVSQANSVGSEPFRLS